MIEAIHPVPNLWLECQRTAFGLALLKSQSQESSLTRAAFKKARQTVLGRISPESLECPLPEYEELCCSFPAPLLKALVAQTDEILLGWENLKPAWEHALWTLTCGSEHSLLAGAQLVANRIALGVLPPAQIRHLVRHELDVHWDRSADSPLLELSARCKIIESARKESAHWEQRTNRIGKSMASESASRTLGG